MAIRVGCHPDVIAFARRMVRRMREVDIPFMAQTMLRSQAAHRHLLKRGVTDVAVEDAAHCYGMAVDLVHARQHLMLPAKCWQLVGHVGKEVALQLGVEMIWHGSCDAAKPYDPAHWELADWQNRKHGFPFI